MDWQVLMAVSVVTFSVSTLLQRWVLRESNSHPIAFSATFQILVGLILFVYGIFGADRSLPKDFSPIWKNLVLSVIFYATSAACIAKSLKQTEASKFTIIFSTKALFTIVAAAIFMQESLNAKQILGTGLVMGAIILVNLKQNKLSFNRGDFLALIAAGCFGLVNASDRYLLKFFNVYPYLVFAFVVPSLFMLSFFPKEVPFTKMYLNKKLGLKILFLSTIYALSSATFLQALKIGTNVSQIAVVNLTSVIITVILALIFLKETDNWIKKLVGAVLSFVGLILVMV